MIATKFEILLNGIKNRALLCQQLYIEAASTEAAAEAAAEAEAAAAAEAAAEAAAQGP